MKRTTLTAAFAAIALAVAAPAAAADPYEPNNQFGQDHPIVGDRQYDADLAGLSDQDWFGFTAAKSTTVTVTVTVTSAAPCDSSIVLRVSLKEGSSAFGGDSAQLEPGQTATLSAPVTAGLDEHLSFETDCGGEVRYTFKLGPADVAAGASAPNEPTGETDTPAPAARAKATRRLARGLYHCFSQSQGQTGIRYDDPFLRYRLKARGRWIDETFAKRKLRARYRYRRGKLTLFTAKGNRLGTYKTYKDSAGHFFEERGSKDPLICRKR